MLCDRCVLDRLWEIFYRLTLRLAVTYGAKCWPIKKHHMFKISIVEMRMLKCMCGETRKDRIRNEGIREHLGSINR